MAKHVLLALTNAAEGKDDDFNAWYEDHMKELLALPGFVSVQRYRLGDAQRSPNTPYKYLAVYQLDTDDLAASMAALGARAGSMNMSVLDTDNLLVNVFTAMGSEVTAG